MYAKLNKNGAGMKKAKYFDREIELDEKFYMSFAQVGAFFDICKKELINDPISVEILKHFYGHYENLMETLLEDE